MSGPLRALLFDAGGTLLFLDHDRMAREVGAATGTPLSAGALDAAVPEAALRMEHRAGTDKDRASRYLRALLEGAGLPPDRWPTAADALYAMHRERHLWSATHPGTAPALALLQARGIPLGVVSNSDGRVEAALEAAGLRRFFDVVIDSALVGVEKPDPAIFAPALEALRVPAADALYLGDLYEVDVVGARAAGMDVMLVDPAGRHAARPDVLSAPSVAAIVTYLERVGRLPVVPATP